MVSYPWGRAPSILFPAKNTKPGTPECSVKHSLNEGAGILVPTSLGADSRYMFPKLLPLPFFDMCSEAAAAGDPQARFQFSVISRTPCY